MGRAPSPCRRRGLLKQAPHRSPLESDAGPGKPLWDGDRRNQFGGLKAEDAKRLKDLERENATLKRLLADAELEKDALKEIARGNF